MEKNTLLQNKFTAYVMKALNNKKSSFLKKKNKTEEISFEKIEQSWIEFDDQLNKYYIEEMSMKKEAYELSNLLKFMDNPYLVEAITGLKKRERRIFFARVLGELSFQEIGKIFDLKPKQAEMLYYYVCRKLRKELDSKNEF